MISSLLVLSLLSQAPPLPPGMVPPKGGKAPPASETARLYFLAGDVARAMEWARKGVKKEPKVCKPMIKALAEYEFLAPKRDEFTLEQARDYLKWDRKIAPAAWSKLSETTRVRFIEGPLKLAGEARTAGNDAEARRLVADVLVVDPKNAEALALKKALGPAPDAGAP